MLKIQINLKGGMSVVLFDPDESDHEKLASQLSELYLVKNVAILKTPLSSVTLRPSDISTINVTPAKKSELDEYNNSIKSQEKPEKDIVFKKISSNDEIQEDIITDMD